MNDYSPPKPGDLCQITRESDGRLLVRHVECDQHSNGTVTDALTGEVVEQ